MKISWDLDGAIADINVGTLQWLRDLGFPEKEELAYYSALRKMIDPYDFATSDDEIVILTGRPIHLKDVTLRWLKKNGLGHIRVIFTKTIPKKPTGTNDEFRAIGKTKAQIFKDEGISVHFDDNEEVVKAMRNEMPDIVVVQVGNRISW